MNQATRKLTAILAAALLVATADLAAAQRPGHTRQIETMIFSPDGKTLVSGGHDGRVMASEVASGDLEERSDEHRLVVSGLAFSADGKRLATASWDGTAAVWSERDEPRLLRGHEDLLYDVAITADGKHVATSSNDKTVRLWDAESGKQLRKHQFVDPVPDGLAFSPDGRTLAVGTRLSTVVLFDVGRWEPTATLNVSGNAGKLMFVNDGKHLLVGTRGVERWDIAKRNKIQHYEPKGRSYGNFGADRAGKVIAALSRRGLTVWPEGDPDASKTLPESGRGTAVAVSPDGKRIAMGGMNGGLVIWDTAKAEVLREIPPGERPAPPESPEKPVATMLGKDLLASDQQDRWRMHAPTGAIHWLDPERGGLSFVAASIPTHMAGRDHMTAATGLGNRAFDLTFDVMIEQTGGPQFFKPGLAVGISSAPVDHMSEDDASAFVALHLDGVFMGVTRGEPYHMEPNYIRLNANAIARAGSAGRKNVVPWSRDAKGTFTRDLPIRVRVRREVGPDPAKDFAEPRHQLVFTMWVPSAGQSYDEPWRRWTWAMPEDMREKPLDHLFIKRIAVTGDHLGAQATGYGKALRVKGRLANMTLRADPPTITDVDHGSDALQPGDHIDIRGAGFNKPNAVSIGGKPAGDVQPLSSTHLRVAIPELAPGRTYDLKVEQPDAGLADVVDAAVPVGRFITDASLIQARPEGGAVVEIAGHGLDDMTEVRVGGKRARVLQVSPTTVKVKVPGGKVGPAPITAKHPDARVHGSIRFAYAARPSVWFTNDELKAFRERSKRKPWKAYRTGLLSPARAVLQDKPRTGRGAAAEAEGVIWAYILTGEKSYRDRIVAWLDHFSKARPFGQWNYRIPGVTAMAYDLVADTLEPELKGRVQHYLMDTIDYYLENDAHGSWFASNATSTNPMVNRGVVPAAIMFADAHPRSDKVIEAAKRFLTHYIDKAISPDGAWTEGMSWASDGLTEYLDVAHLLAKRRGDRSLLGRQRLALAVRQYEVMLATSDELLVYNNMHGSLKGVAIAAHVDAAHGSPLLRWVADRVVDNPGRRNAGDLGLAMMWRSDKPSPANPPEPPILAKFDDVNWVTMRSHSRVDTPLLVGLKGIQNGPQPYHQQRDAGSFTIFAGGEPLIVDPGWGQSRANQHSLPLVEGQGPDRWGAALTDTWSDGPWRAAVVDATDAYHWKSGARRVRRTVAMHRDNAVVVVDDIAPGRGKPGKVAWKLQTLTAELDGKRTVRIVGKNASMTGKLFGPVVETSVRKHKRRFREVYWHTVTADYTAAPDRPLVTVFEVAEDADAPTVEADVKYQPDRITVDLGERGKLTFRQTDAGWGMVKPGGKADDLLLTPMKPQPKPRVLAVRAEQPPKLDGKLDDALWRSANPASGFKPTDTWQPQEPVRVPTEARFAWDEQNLYIAIRAHEPKLDQIVSTIVGPAQSLHGDDHLQLFIDPGREHHGNRFFGYRFPASGMHLGWYGKMGDLGGTKLTVHAGRETGDPSAWTLEIALPWSSLLTDPWRKLTVNEPKSGLAMSMNLQRFRMPEPEETSTWARSAPTPTAVPWRWGTLVLE